MLTNLIAQVVTTTTGDPASDRGLITSLVIWLFVGLVAGFLGSKIVNKRGEGVVVDIVLGLIGAVVGGFLFSLVGIHSGGSIIFSIIVATIGAVIVLLIYHKVIRGDRTTV